MMKQLFGPIVVSVATVVLIIACRSDVIIEPPPSIVGNYTGYYIYKTGQGSSADSLMQPINFRLTDSRWNMEIDTASAEFNTQVCLCNAFGTYALTDRVRLSLDQPETPYPVPPCQACDPAEKPQGSYTLEQPAYGIKLTWIQTIDNQIITSQLILTRVAN